MHVSGRPLENRRYIFSLQKAHTFWFSFPIGEYLVNELHVDIGCINREGKTALDIALQCAGAAWSEEEKTAELSRRQRRHRVQYLKRLCRLLGTPQQANDKIHNVHNWAMIYAMKRPTISLTIS